MTDSDKKVVDWIFGDDTWFLSWLWIDVPQSDVEEKVEVPVVEKKIDKEIPEATKEKKKSFFSRSNSDDVKTATVIKKAQPKPNASIDKGNITTVANTRKPTKPKKKDTSVDDLIKRKSWWDYMWNIEWRSRPASTRPARGGPSRWWARKPWWRPTWWRGRWTWAPQRDGKLMLWRTSYKKKSTTSTKQIIADQTKKKKTYKVSENLKKKETILVDETITVKEFSEKMWVPLSEVMKVMLMNKIVVAAQASIDFDTAQLVWSEFWVIVEREKVEMTVEDVVDANLESILAQDKEAEDLVTRPPVVTIMGHVDHWKTKLLDYLRKSDVVWGEAGWITQSIWASQIVHNDKKITFIDTPGHELFSSLRARWSKITNIVIIVVAADDGVKPQTVEAIRHAKDAWVPIIVAITKVDLGNPNMDRIKWQLAEQELTPEDWWWDVMIVPCSSITGQWIDDLLEAIHLQADMLELQYSPWRNAVWVVVESNKDAKQWVMTTLLVMTWTLRVWDIVVIHNTFWKVKRMTNWKWEQIAEATWWDAVMILWVNMVPEPGRMIEVVENEKTANKKMTLIKEHEEKHKKEVAMQSILDRLSEGEIAQLKLILKADSSWSLEAIKHATTKLNLAENVEVKIIHDDVWDITDSDLNFARAADAIVVWYNVPLKGPIIKKADQYKVILKQFDIIYEFIEYVEDLSQWLIEEEKVETLIWKMNVLALFYTKWKEMIVWWKIIEWRVDNHATFKVMRGEDQWATWKILSLQKEQDSVKTVKVWHECGIKIRTSKKVLEDDTIEFYTFE